MMELCSGMAISMMSLALGLCSMALMKGQKVSRDVTDEEILRYVRGRDDNQDQDGFYLLRSVRTNQTISMLMRGAQQMGLSGGGVQSCDLCAQRADSPRDAPQMLRGVVSVDRKGDWQEAIHYHQGTTRS